VDNSNVQRRMEEWKDYDWRTDDDDYHDSNIYLR
jgi:hypothetical protein